jgi:hypothetical protein
VPGSRAEIAARIPFTVPIVRHLVGQLHGTATLDEFDPPFKLTYSLATPQGVGRIAVLFSETATGCLVSVDGWTLPRSSIAKMTLLPLASLLDRLASRAIDRGIHRAASITSITPDHEQGM